jgi:hypothetical protein
MVLDPILVVSVLDIRETALASSFLQRGDVLDNSPLDGRQSVATMPVMGAASTSVTTS